MRNQYKALAEKYNLINEAFSSLTGNFNTEGNQDLIQALRTYTPCTTADIEALIDWMNRIYRKELGFAPPSESSETNDDIFMQLVYVYADNNGLLTRNGEFITYDEFSSSSGISISIKAVANQFYSDYLKHLGVSKEIKSGEDKARVKLDI